MIKTKSREYIRKLHPSGWKYERAKREMRKKDRTRRNLYKREGKAQIKQEG